MRTTLDELEAILSKFNFKFVGVTQRKLKIQLYHILDNEHSVSHLSASAGYK